MVRVGVVGLVYDSVSSQRSQIEEMLRGHVTKINGMQWSVGMKEGQGTYSWDFGKHPSTTEESWVVDLQTVCFDLGRGRCFPGEQCSWPPSGLLSVSGLGALAA